MVGVVLKRCIDFHIYTTYSYSSCICFLLQSMPTFCSFLIIKIELKVRMILPKITNKGGVRITKLKSISTTH